MDHPVTLEE
jgi:pre-mRNA-processing factor 40